MAKPPLRSAKSYGKLDGDGFFQRESHGRRATK